MAKFALDAGHGRYTAGKRCLKSLDPNETREWFLNDRVTDYLAIFLESAGHETFRVDDEDDGSTDIELKTRVAIANKMKADAYLSQHHNAGIYGRAGGGSVVYACVGCQAKSTQLQNAIYKNLIAYAGLKGNRADGTPNKDFYVIKNTTMPAVLTECGYMDAPDDIKYILDQEWSKKAALGIAMGVCEVFGGTVKADIAPGTKPSYTDKTPEEKAKLAVDGSFGPASVRATQAHYGTVVDGIVSNQPSGNSKYLPNVYEDVWEFTSNYEDGSAMVRAMQTDLKEKGYYTGNIDGWCGKMTVEALQSFLRDQGLYAGAIDGSMGPLTVKAWQQYLNKQ